MTYTPRIRDASHNRIDQMLPDWVRQSDTPPPEHAPNPHMLDHTTVYEIRRDYAAGSTRSELADKYGSSYPAVVRIVRGETYPDAPGPTTGTNPTLTDDEVLQIRRLYANRQANQRQLSRKFGTNCGTVSRIVRGKLYADVGGPRTHRNPGCVLDVEDATAIRQEYATGTTSQASLAERYDVSKSTVSRVLHGDTYPDAGGPIL